MQFVLFCVTTTALFTNCFSVRNPKYTQRLCILFLPTKWQGIRGTFLCCPNWEHLFPFLVDGDKDASGDEKEEKSLSSQCMTGYKNAQKTSRISGRIQLFSINTSSVNCVTNYLNSVPKLITILFKESKYLNKKLLRKI